MSPDPSFNKNPGVPRSGLQDHGEARLSDTRCAITTINLNGTTDDHGQEAGKPKNRTIATPLAAPYNSGKDKRISRQAVKKKGGRMKRKIAYLLTITTLVVMASCGGDTGTTGQPPDATPAGKNYDCPYFRLILAAGWDAGPATSGMVTILPKGQVSPGLYFKFEGNGNAAGTAAASINSMILNYGGSSMIDTIIGGIGFKTTTYIYSGMTQTMHVAFRNGTKITITIEGAGATDNPAIRSMLGTVAFK